MHSIPNAEDSQFLLTQGAILNRMTHRIRQSLDLQEILAATVTELRSFLQTDRVKVYRFQADGSGEVIAEAIAEQRLPSLLGLCFPASDIPPASRELFIKARLRSIVDVPAQQITLSRLLGREGPGPLTLDEVQHQPLEEILQRPVDPCHVEYLTVMGVQSSLVVPILHRQSLWGLLVSHHATPKQVSEQDLQIVQMLADQVSIAIAQSHLLTQAQEKARRESLINQIATLLHAPLQVQDMLQVVLEQVVKAVQGSGGRLYLYPSDRYSPATLYTYGSQPISTNPTAPTFLEETRFWQQLLPLLPPSRTHLPPPDPDLAIPLDLDYRFPYNLHVIPDLYQQPQLASLVPLFEPTAIRSLLIMPLQYGAQCLGCLTLFRDHINTDILWAGRFDPDERQQRVRESFSAWRELKLNQAQEWLPEEVELIHALGTHLTLAIMQHRLYQYEHEQRILVEMRNQQLHAARSAAEEASRLKSDFLSSTSHELRTPLASTLNYLKILKEGFYDNEAELQDYIQVAHQSAENLVAIINDVLDIAKIEAGRMPMEREILDLPALLAEQAHLFMLESQHKGIALVVDCQANFVYADKVKVRQILTNLLSNAFKFTTQGEIRVLAQPQPGDAAIAPPLIQISVRDTGIGIDPRHREFLFEPFVQADGSIKRRYGGTGLGLAVCKRLVSLMGGDIWLESPGPGQGTTVTVTLPAPPSPTNSPPSTPDNSP